MSDIDGTPFGLESLAPGTGTLLDTDAYSEELQLSGTGLGGQLEYIGGVYYFHSKARDNSTAIFFDLPGIRQDVDIDSERKDEMVAGYAQGTYDLSSLTGLQGLGFTVGMRYTSEKVTLEQLPGSQLRDLPIPGAENTRSEKFNRLSWTVGLQEQLNDNVLIYGVSRSSFRSGGFNTFAAPLPGTAEDGGSGFDMEKVIDFELGVKFAGHLGGAPSRLNIALFHQKVDAVQRSIYVDPDGPGPLTVAGFTANIPEAKIKGVEVDGVVSPTVWLDLGMSLAYNDAEFSKDTAVLFGQSKTYGPYPDTPEFTGSVYVSTTTSLPNNWGELNLRGDMFHQSHFYFGSLDNFTVPGTKLPHYTLANFRAGVDDILGSAVSVTAHVKNAFDKKYYVGGIPVGEVLSVNAAVPGEPRTYFVELGYKF